MSIREANLFSPIYFDFNKSTFADLGINDLPLSESWMLAVSPQRK